MLIRSVAIAFFTSHTNESDTIYPVKKRLKTGEKMILKKVPPISQRPKRSRFCGKDTTFSQKTKNQKPKTENRKPKSKLSLC